MNYNSLYAMDLLFYFKNKLTQVAASVGERVTGGPAVIGALVGLAFCRELASAPAGA